MSEPYTNPYDAIVVGGGVAGALVATRLTRSGKRVLILEAGSGDAMDPVRYGEILATYYAMGSSRATPNGPYPVNPLALSPNDSAHDPYFVQTGSERFLSDYLRMLGGSTLHWQGTSLRMLPNDFRMQSEYGRAVNWPISYTDLEPYYREAEGEIGVAADVEDQREVGAWYPDGYVYPMKRMPQSLIDKYIAERLNGVTVSLDGGDYPLRVVSLATARNSVPNPEYNGGHGYETVSAVGNPYSGQRCQGNSSCSPLCPVQAKYNAMKTLSAAMAHGKLEVRTRCVASVLNIDSETGRITGVEYKRYTEDGKSGYVTETAKGTIVVLAANAIENTVLMLASRIVDKSDQLGRNLMDHPYISLQGLASKPVYPFRGPDVTSGVETLRDGKFRAKHASFRASIGNWGWVGEPAATVSALLAEGRFGRDFRETLANRMTRMVKLGVFLEQLPDPANRVTIDAKQTDPSGNYRPILNYSYSDYTLEGGLTAIQTVWPLITKYAGIEDKTDFTAVPQGFQAVTYRGVTYNVMGPGHIVGTHRMGDNPDTSVIDTNLRSWAHPNLYAVGAGSMVTIGTSNPTLTAAALALRAATHILKELN